MGDGSETAVVPDVTAYDGSAPSRVWAQVTELYVRVFSDPPYRDDPTDLARIAEWGPRRLSAPGGRLVVATDPGQDGRVVAGALGYRLDADAGSWHDVLRSALTPVEAVAVLDLADEVVTVRELAVDAAYRGRGLGERCLRRLLADRPERRAVLATFAEGADARAAYARWGFDEVGHARVRDDTLELLVLSRELPWK